MYTSPQQECVLKKKAKAPWFEQIFGRDVLSLSGENNSLPLWPWMVSLLVLFLLVVSVSLNDGARQRLGPFLAGGGVALQFFTISLGMFAAKLRDSRGPGSPLYRRLGSWALFACGIGGLAGVAGAVLALL